MDVDVDGAPNAYGPPGKPALDILQHGHALPETGPSRAHRRLHPAIPGGPPKNQGPARPPTPATTSPRPPSRTSRTLTRTIPAATSTPRRSTTFLGRDARSAGVRIGDFASVYSCRTGKRVWAIVADSGNESGAEGSLALVRALGYTHITNGIDDPSTAARSSSATTPIPTRSSSSPRPFSTSPQKN